MTYAIRFDYPEGDTAYAGLFQGAFGWAPTVKTALMYDTAEQAATVLKNVYASQSDWGKVVEVKI